MLRRAQRSAWSVRARDAGTGLPKIESLWIRRVEVLTPPHWRARAPRLTRLPERMPSGTTFEFLCVSDARGHIGLWGPLETSVAMLVLHWLRPRVEGRRFAGPQEAYDTIYAAERHGRSGLTILALSALDLALWDLLGQVREQPVYALFGGVRRPLSCYASLLSFALASETAPALALEAHSLGFLGAKWAVRDGMAEAAVPTLAAIARRRPPDFALMVDALGAWDLDTAQHFCAEVVNLDLDWIEEPLSPRAWTEYGKLIRSTPVPVAAGEHAYTRYEAMALIDQGISIVQPDAGWCGGLTELGHIAEAAGAAGVSLIPHGAGLIPAVHLGSILGSGEMAAVEYHMTIEPHRQACFTEPLLPQNGVIVAPETPGLGIRIDPNRVSWKDITSVGDL
jgi:L-rhamnonate dehydratase